MALAVDAKGTGNTLYALGIACCLYARKRTYFILRVTCVSFTIIVEHLRQPWAFAVLPFVK